MEVLFNIASCYYWGCFPSYNLAPSHFMYPLQGARKESLKDVFRKEFNIIFISLLLKISSHDSELKL
jgi:hypothetical protein